MAKKIKFIHAADLHIDAPFKGLTSLATPHFNTIKNSTFDAFDRLINTAINKEVDFILLAGDIFDEENQSIHAKIHVRDGFLKLQNYQIQVFLSYGNHDYVLGDSFPITFPENVHIFPNETVQSLSYEQNGEKLASIYGFSYESPTVTNNKINEYPQYVDESIPYHIAMLHGSLNGEGDHREYAPFSLQQLQSTPFHYWALGHIHKRQVLQQSPPIIYPGNIQGRHSKETGEKGCYYCELNGNRSSFQFIPLQSIQFAKVQLKVSQLDKISDIENELIILENYSHYPTLFEVEFISNSKEIIRMEEEGILEELITIWNESFIDDDNWRYIYKYRINIREEKEHDPYFVQQLRKNVNELNMKESTSELSRHHILREIRNDLHDENIKSEVNKLLNYYFK